MRSRSRCTRPAWSISTASPSFSASRARRRSRSSGTASSSTRRRGAPARRPGGRQTPISPARSARSSRSPSTPRSRIRDFSATSRRSRTLFRSPSNPRRSPHGSARHGFRPTSSPAFCEEILGVPTRVFHTVEIASWSHRGQRLPQEPRLDHGLGHAAPPRRRTRLGRAQFHPAADLRYVHRGWRREARPQRGRHRGGEGQARQDQAGLRGLDLDRHGAGRRPCEDLQRAVQQPRAAALRRLASDTSPARPASSGSTSTRSAPSGAFSRPARPMSLTPSAPERPSPSPPRSWSRNGSASSPSR